MGWKYIMFENRIGELRVLFPVIFPDKMLHSDVYQGLMTFMPGWWSPGGGVQPVSAGSIEHVVVSGIGGSSETLGLEPDPDSDARVIDSYSYTHGIL